MSEGFRAVGLRRDKAKPKSEHGWVMWQSVTLKAPPDAWVAAGTAGGRYGWWLVRLVAGTAGDWYGWWPARLVVGLRSKEAQH